ncbi:unnamed protein product [Leuciscus chuanchicus]
MLPSLPRGVERFRAHQQEEDPSDEGKKGEKKNMKQDANLAQELFRGLPLGLSVLALIRKSRMSHDAGDIPLDASKDTPRPARDPVKSPDSRENGRIEPPFHKALFQRPSGEPAHVGEIQRGSLLRAAQPAQMMVTPEIQCRTALWDQTARGDAERNKEPPALARSIRRHQRG